MSNFSSADEAYFGVERSFGGKKWQMRQVDERLALAIAQRWNIPELLARVLAARGIDLDSVESFLNPTLRATLPDPSIFKDMDVGIERLVTAVMRNELVAILGDYDVDGATASALVSRFLRSVGGRSIIYIPDRIAEGYGPNLPALLKLKEQGVSVIITVDCGTTAYEVLDVAADKGLDIIIVDHHKVETKLPNAFAVINPNRLDENQEFSYLAAVGVAFLLIVGINRALRSVNWYRDRPAPDPISWLDFVALGTICDVVPLQGLNRALVYQGLKVMAKRCNAGLSALADLVGIKNRPSTYHAGFLLGPRINAGGRIGKSRMGVDLLTTDDPHQAKGFARTLDDYNVERQELEARILEQAVKQSEEESDPFLVLVANEGWHPGVIGIVAARLVERFNRPACVVSFSGTQGVGSGRSVSGVDLGSAVIAARQKGLLLKGGGHAMAAGFTVARDAFKDLRTFLSGRLRKDIPETGFVPLLKVDGIINPCAVTYELLKILDRAAPYGIGNAEPRFVIPDALINRASIVGKNHIRCFLSTAGRGGGLKAIAFRSLDSDLGQALLRHSGRAFHVAGRLRSDTWQDKEGVQLFIDDVVFAS